MASNVVSTTDQTRQDYQYSSSVDGLLKQVYIPALNNVTFHATPLMQMFGDFGGTIDFVGNKIIKAFKHQGAGGFGGISEGGDWVNGRDQKGFQGSERIKYLNAYVSLTGPAARTVKSGEGAYVDAISSAMDDTLRLAQMQMERIIGGNGLGELARFTAAAISETAIADGEYFPSTNAASDSTFSDETLTAIAGAGAYSTVQWLQEGMRVMACLTSELDGTVPSTDLYGPFVVERVDYDAGTFALKASSPSAAQDDISDLASADVSLVLEGAYGQEEAAGGTTADQCLEPNGLVNLVDTTTYTSWGLTRATYPRALNSKVVAAASAELDEELLMGWVLDMANLRQSVPNVCVVDPKSRLKYFSNRKEDRRFDMPVLNTSFGFQSLGVTIDNYTLILQSLSSLLPGSLFLLNVGDFKFAKATGGFEWVTDGPMGAFRQKEGSDNLYATAVNYMNFVCENPMGQLKVTGLAT